MPDPDKTFYRSSTDYFVNGRQQDIGAFDSPKFIGLPIGEILSVGKQELTVQTISELTNGDGLNTLYKRKVVGFRINNAYLLCDFEQEGQHFWQYRVIPNEMPTEFSKLRLPHALNRNLNHNWQQALSKTSSERNVSVNWQLALSEQAFIATAISEEDICAQATLQGPFALARQTDSNAQHIQDTFSKLGNTPYYAG